MENDGSPHIEGAALRRVPSSLDFVEGAVLRRVPSQLDSIEGAVLRRVPSSLDNIEGAVLRRMPSSLEFIEGAILRRVPSQLDSIEGAFLRRVPSSLYMENYSREKIIPKSWEIYMDYYPWTIISRRAIPKFEKIQDIHSKLHNSQEKNGM